MSIFVGRDTELEAWGKRLEHPAGELLLLVGREGMGKTSLLKQVERDIEAKNSSRYGCVLYEVTRQDLALNTMGLMLDDVWIAARKKPGSFSNHSRPRKQWKAVLNALLIGSLVDSLRSDAKAHPRDQLISTLNTISEKMREDARLVLIIDPFTLLSDGSDEEWVIVARSLPDKIKIIVAQQPEDALASNTGYRLEPKIRRFNHDPLGGFTKDEVGQLVQRHRLKKTIEAREKIQSELFAKYHGHPLSTSAALGLLPKVGGSVKSLPNDPSGLAQRQWDRARDTAGDKATALLTAYSILEVAVDDKLADYVADLKAKAAAAIRQNPYMKTLLEGKSDGRRLYHRILGNPAEQLKPEKTKNFHRRAVKAYRKRVKQNPASAQSLIRLPGHVRAAKGNDAFVRCVIDEVGNGLCQLGLLEDAERLISDAIKVTKPRSLDRAALQSQLANVERLNGCFDDAVKLCTSAQKIYRQSQQTKCLADEHRRMGVIRLQQGELDLAKKSLHKAMSIFKDLEDDAGYAKTLTNLGGLLQVKGEYDAAEQVLHQGLMIHEELGDEEGVATVSGNLGNIAFARSDFELATKFYSKSRKLFEKLQHTEGLANLFYQIGHLQKAKGRKPETVRRSWRKAVQYAEQLGNLEMVYQIDDEIDSLGAT